MAYPTNDPRAELCAVVGGDGVTVYGNAAGMRNLSTWLKWIAASRPEDHFECHLLWHLRSQFRKRPRVWILFERPDTSPTARGGVRGRRDRFDVTFMMVTAEELKALRRHETSGLLPKHWGAQGSLDGERADTPRRRPRQARSPAKPKKQKKRKRQTTSAG